MEVIYIKKSIKLVTFQSFEAYESLKKKGYLESTKRNIDFDKVGYAYKWIVAKMNERVKNEYYTEYPLWCWVKCYNGVCPPKRKGKSVAGFDVKITFHKNIEDVFITDFIRYSFLLNNQFIPANIKELKVFRRQLEEYNITDEDLLAFVRKDKYKTCRDDKEFLSVCEKIRKSFDRCITKESSILQGCVWRISKDEIDKIEIVPQDGHVYGSVNYVRSNGKRKDWIKEFIRSLERGK